MLLVTALLGLGAGVLTTIAGMGGGVLLVIAFSLLRDPRTALVATAPALLLGNLHRLWMFRTSIAWRVARPFVIGALAGSLLGGFVLPRLPERGLTWLMLAMTVLGVTKAMSLWSWQPPASAILPAAAVVGATSATAGGAGVLAAPLLMATGLGGVPYVATAAAGACAMHLGRICAYGISGLVTREALDVALVLALTIPLGNLLGKRLRAHLAERTSSRLEVASLVCCVVLALCGVGR